MEKDKPRVAVVGSSNMDLVCKSGRIPAVGETILGGDFIMAPGGKGANQAVAAARLGAEVFFIALLGKDIFGKRALENFRQLGVNTKYVLQTREAPSGVALIMVDEKGNNSIVVAPGANGKLSPDDVEKARGDIASAGAVAGQLEVPLETIEYTADAAKSSNVPFILDPAPARELGDELLSKVDILTPNETEAGILTGIEISSEQTARRASQMLLGRGVKAVILTMGKQGYLLADKEQSEFVPAQEVEAVDSTAAGDAFTGALAVGIAEGKHIAEAARFANFAAALSVTKMGAQPSMPSIQDVDQFIKNRGNS